MDKILEDNIRHEATALANYYNITDTDRVISIMKKIVIGLYGSSTYVDLRFVPVLNMAFVFLPPETAMDILENSKLDELISKTTIIEYLFIKQALFYNHSELAGLIEKFIKYLKKNKTSLISIGYPAKSFEISLWFYTRLSPLYPIKIPDTIQNNRTYTEQIVAEINGYAEKDNEGNLIFDYSWLKEKQHQLAPISGTLRHCKYEEAYIIDGISEQDIEHIEEQRVKLFNLKLKILNIAYDYLTLEKDYNSFWDECIDAISVKLSIGDFQLFNRIEEKYTNIFLRHQLPGGTYLIESNPLKLNPITDDPKKDKEAGGIKNFFDFIYLIEEELKIGKMHNTKTRLLPLINYQIPESYYQLVMLPTIADIDNAIFDFLAYDDNEIEFAKMFDKRLEKDVKEKFKQPLYVNPEKYDAIESYSQFLETHHNIGIDVTGRFVAPIPQSKKIVPIKLPLNTKWHNITISFSDGHDVDIIVKGEKIRSDYKQMGFEDRKQHKPNMQWELLKLLAKQGGEITWDDPQASDNLKKTKQLLSKALKIYFQIDEDPFFPYKENNSYNMRIHLIPE